jgi:transcriptional regulator with XRE-family HTH domain
MNLKTLRTQMSLTQKQLAEKMDTTQQTIARWETGKTQLNSAQIKQLCGLLHCTVQDLLGWDLGDDFDERSFFEHGEPYGTLRLNFAFGVHEFPIGEVARDEVDGFLSRRSVLNSGKESADWLALTAMSNRLLLVNPAAIRTLAIISDEVEAMPSFDDDADSEEADEAESWLKEALRVTFSDGTEEAYLMSQAAANDLYAILAGNDPHAGSMLIVEDPEAGHFRTYVNLSRVAMIELPAGMFHAMTTDDDGSIEAYQ